MIDETARKLFAEFLFYFISFENNEYSYKSLWEAVKDIKNFSISEGLQKTVNEALSLMYFKTLEMQLRYSLKIKPENSLDQEICCCFNKCNHLFGIDETRKKFVIDFIPKEIGSCLEGLKKYKELLTNFYSCPEAFSKVAISIVRKNILDYMMICENHIMYHVSIDAKTIILEFIFKRNRNFKRI